MLVPVSAATKLSPVCIFKKWIMPGMEASVCTSRRQGGSGGLPEPHWFENCLGNIERLDLQK